MITHPHEADRQNALADAAKRYDQQLSRVPKPTYAEQKAWREGRNWTRINQNEGEG